MAFGGISALDIALWDIKGKFFNVPVHRLLGGKRRDKLRSYASQLQFDWEDGIHPRYATQDYAASAKKAVEDGFDAIKVDFFTYDKDGQNFTPEDTTRILKPYYVDLVEERVAAVREAVIPNFCIHEHHIINRAFRVHDYQPENGYITIPDIPGIGNEFTEETVKKTQSR